MTLDQILRTAALSLAGGSSDLVIMLGEHDIREAARRAGYIERGGWGALVENDAARNGLKLEFTGGYVKITLARPNKPYDENRCPVERP